MGKSSDSEWPVGGERAPSATGAGTCEVLIPHGVTVAPLSAVRNLFVQSSLAGLKANGFHERYVQLVDQSVLSQLLSSLGPGWTSVELASAHWEACDRLGLTQQELMKIGGHFGNRLQESALVSSATKVRDDDLETLGCRARPW